MRIALYIEDGLEQIVLTPETRTEKGIVEKLTDGSRELSIKKGSFFECRGGWVRFNRHIDREGDDDSTMIVLRQKSPTKTQTTESSVAQSSSSADGSAAGESGPPTNAPAAALSSDDPPSFLLRQGDRA